MVWASEEDLAAISDIDVAASLEPFGSSHLLRYCSRQMGAGALVYWGGAGVEGFVLFSLVLDEGSIDNIAVHPGAQRRGLGGVLLREALDALRDAGARRCLLDVRESNLPALALYARHGFSPDGRRPGYYTTATGREDAVLMSRRI